MSSKSPKNIAGNRGRTSLKCKRRIEDPMKEYDRLSPELRAWLAQAILPWRPRSVKRAYERAFSKLGSKELAMNELDRQQARRIHSDVKAVWGDDHPSARAHRYPRPILHR